ncbi:MAG: hypothetical protein HN842_09995 [Gammaproteobacteria bacterium]|nr:hypothetical protein [Gammaproteobacteria bacterium]MBT7308537.1 hypothetical protein [Gammaproteobacteria bacterium]
MAINGEEELLFIIEYGVYPELIRALQTTTYRIKVEHQMRRAISFLKKKTASVVVAEFYHEPAFRDRVSNLESMLAHIQRKLPDTQVVVLYRPEDTPHLQQLMGRFPLNHTLPTPVQPAQLLAVIGALPQ